MSKMNSIFCVAFCYRIICCDEVKLPGDLFPVQHCGRPCRTEVVKNLESESMQILRGLLTVIIVHCVSIGFQKVSCLHSQSRPTVCFPVSPSSESEQRHPTSTILSVFQECLVAPSKLSNAEYRLGLRLRGGGAKKQDSSQAAGKIKPGNGASVDAAQIQKKNLKSAAVTKPTKGAKVEDKKAESMSEAEKMDSSDSSSELTDETNPSAQATRTVGKGQAQAPQPKKPVPPGHQNAATQATDAAAKPPGVKGGRPTVPTAAAGAAKTDSSAQPPPTKPPVQAKGPAAQKGPPAAKPAQPVRAGAAAKAEPPAKPAPRTPKPSR